MAPRWPPSLWKDPPEEETAAALQAAYSISRHRTLQQDCAFGIRQIVDMALRALSPSTNDTTTAVMCVDYLAAILARLASRNIPSSHRYEEGELRVIAVGPTFASLVAESFDQIRAAPQAMSPSCYECSARSNHRQSDLQPEPSAGAP